MTPVLIWNFMKERAEPSNMEVTYMTCLRMKMKNSFHSITLLTLLQFLKKLHNTCNLRLSFTTKIFILH